MTSSSKVSVLNINFDDGNRSILKGDRFVNTALTRRRFLRRRHADDERAIRPPWSLNQTQFLDRCTRCGDCARACSEKIVTIDDGGLPQINFRLGACTFCGECVAVCDSGALRRIDADPPPSPWSLDVAFKRDCLEQQGITCRVCGDGCEQKAIRFRANDERRFPPSLDASHCNGCGYCRSVCPIDAVTIKPTATTAMVL